MALLYQRAFHRSFFSRITNVENRSLEHCLNTSDPLALGSGYSPTVHYTVVSLHALVIFISVSLNSAICHVYRKGAVRKVPFNALLVNLAVADILTSLGMIPFIAVSPIYLRGLSQGIADVVCTVTVGQFLFWIGDAASIMTLCMISVNRYIIINHSMTPLERFLRRKSSTALMISIPWVLGIALPLPNIISRKFEWCSTKCPRAWPTWINGAAYAIATTAVGYAMPIGIMFYTLLASIRTLWFRKITEETDITLLKYRKRIVILLCTLIGTFFFWWTPFAVYWIMSTATHVFPNGDEGYYNRAKVIYIVTLAALINAAANPIIYGLKSDDFRHAIKEEITISLRSSSLSTYTPLRDNSDPVS